jgi:hypothetical protein
MVQLAHNYALIYALIYASGIQALILGTCGGGGEGDATMLTPGGELKE